MIDKAKIKIIRSNRQSMVMHVLPGGVIEVKAPYLMPSFFINQFVKKHADWVEKKSKVLVGVKAKKDYIEDEKFLYLGHEYSLKFGNYTKIEIKGENLLFPIGLKFRAKKELENWYIKQAKEKIKFQVEASSVAMSAEYRSISFSDTKSKWGSCTHDNRLQFNWRLIMAPMLVLRYVVVHELAHTKEKNHSQSFWSRVRAQNPSYREQVKWLKINGDGLIL